MNDILCNDKQLYVNKKQKRKQIVMHPYKCAPANTCYTLLHKKNVCKSANIEQINWHTRMCYVVGLAFELKELKTQVFVLC